MCDGSFIVVNQTRWLTSSIAIELMQLSGMCCGVGPLTGQSCVKLPPPSVLYCRP